MSHTNVFVLDQESAKAFYTEKLGLELRFDITMGEEFEGTGAGFRWLTVGPKDQPDLQIILASCDMGRSPEAADQRRDLPVGTGGAPLRDRGDDARRLGQHDQPGATRGVRRGRRSCIVTRSM